MYPVLFPQERQHSRKSGGAGNSGVEMREGSEEEDAIAIEAEVKKEAESDGEGGQAVVKRRRCRYACLPCRQRKVRCDGGQPCGLCLKQKRECHYPFKARMATGQPQMAPIGPAPAVQSQSPQMTSMPFPPAVHSPVAPSVPADALRAVVEFDSSSPEVPDVSIPSSVTLIGARFGTTEMHYLDTYLKFSYHYLPLVSPEQVRSSLQFDRGMSGLTRAERVKMNANLASTWAVAAIGGCFVDPAGGMQCLHTALEYLRDCFDMPLADSVNAYLAVCEACYRIGLDDSSTWMKYVGFADVLEREVDPQQLPASLRAILSFYHSMLTTTSNRQISSGSTSPGPSSPKALPMVLNRADVDPVVNDIEVMASAYEIMGLIVRNKLDGDEASRRKLIDVAVLHLTAMAMKLAVDGTKVGSTSGVNYFMANVFLAYFHVKTGRLREARFCLTEMIAVQEVCPLVLQSPRTIRCPFLMMQVLERMQMWEARAMAQRQVERERLVYDGLYDDTRVEEAMIMDMVRTLDGYFESSPLLVPEQLPVRRFEFEPVAATPAASSASFKMLPFVPRQVSPPQRSHHPPLQRHPQKRRRAEDSKPSAGDDETQQRKIHATTGQPQQQQQQQQHHHHQQQQRRYQQQQPQQPPAPSPTQSLAFFDTLDAQEDLLNLDMLPAVFEDLPDDDDNFDLDTLFNFLS